MERRPYSLEVEALDLGAGTKAIGLALIVRESGEPFTGEAAAFVWAVILPALTAGESFVLDFFSHLERVREFCRLKKILFREEAGRCLVIPQPLPEQLLELLKRFEGETFGLRAGAAAKEGDLKLEEQLSAKGLDGYQDAYPRYTFCAVCELEDGWVTVLTEKLGAGELLRRAQKAVEPLAIAVSGSA